jgi:hypothetical protein
MGIQESQTYNSTVDVTLIQPSQDAIPSSSYSSHVVYCERILLVGKVVELRAG